VNLKNIPISRNSGAENGRDQVAQLEVDFTHVLYKFSIHTQHNQHVDRKKPPPPGVFPIYYVPSSTTVSKRTPLEAPGTISARGVLLLTVLDQGTW